jgi:hypothetical protein
MAQYFGRRRPNFGASSRRERVELALQFTSTSIGPSVGAIPIALAVARGILVRITESAAAARERERERERKTAA